MADPALLPASVVRRLLPLAEAQSVSVVSRARGFTRAYLEADGDVDRIGRGWLARRRAFLARHRAAAKAHGEAWWTAGGEPTRRHLALAMWAWSPTRARLEALRPTERARHVGPSIGRFYEKQARLARADIGDRSLRLPELRIERPIGGWGGRFQPAKHPVIFLYPARSHAINRAIVVHELGHWVRHHTGDRIGYHDEAFCSPEVLQRMYHRARIPLRVQRAVEREGGCLS
jgi:hypothetical protein